MALIGTLTSGVSALSSFSSGLDVIGNNIANVNTVGFKSASTSFEDSFSNTIAGGQQIGTGVQVASVTTSFTQGSLNSTGNTTDLGISGNGYFIVKDPNSGTQSATRDGQFTVDPSGYLTTQAGMRVQGLVGGTSAVPLGTTVGDIRIGQSLPANTSLQSISIDTSGNVHEFYSDGTSAVTNQVELQNFSAPANLTKSGDNLYGSLSAAGPVGGGILAGNNGPSTNGLGTIQAGTLESSNVDLTQQFSDLITMQRSFQAGARLITVSDTVLQDITDLKRS